MKLKNELLIIPLVLFLFCNFHLVLSINTDSDLINNGMSIPVDVITTKTFTIYFS